MTSALDDRDLVRLHWPVALRPAFDALLAIDDAMGAAVGSASQPALAAIKLAWWRGALERLDHESPPPEPRLQTAAAELLPRGISGADLAALEAGWAALLDQPPDRIALGERGTLLFRIGAHLLGAPFDDASVGAAGRLFARVDVARRGCLDLAARTAGPGHVPFPKRLRPLTALAVLAARDLRRGGPPFEDEATPGRALALLVHRLTGRLPARLTEVDPNWT